MKKWTIAHISYAARRVLTARDFCGNEFAAYQAYRQENDLPDDSDAHHKIMDQVGATWREALRPPRQ